MTGASAAFVGGASTPSMGVHATPGALHGAYGGSSTSSVPITTNATLATVSGGLPAYVYAWTQNGASPDTWVINSATAATTTFTASSVPAGATASASFKVTVTDAVGTVATAFVTAEVENLSTG